MIASVDGCKKGWIVSKAPSWPLSERPELYLCIDFKSVISTTSDCDIIVVDIPIGLADTPIPRKCDVLARKLLGPAASRIFTPPARQLLCARNKKQFHDLHRKFFGKPAGIISYSLLEKIRDVDEHITAQMQDRIMEFHPELTWLKLAGTPLPSKHTALGVLMRMNMIRKYYPCLDELNHCNICADIAIDDLLDSLVGLATAHCIATGPDYNRRLPKDELPRDNRNLRMEIWY